MAAGLLPYRPRVQTNADWLEEPWMFFTGPFSTTDLESNTPDDFTGCHFSAGLLDRTSGAVLLEMTDQNGFLTFVAPNTVYVSVLKATMATLALSAGAPDAPTICDFDLTCIHPDGYAEALIYAIVELVQGIAA